MKFQTAKLKKSKMFLPIRGPGGHTGFSKQYKKQQHLISTSPKIFLQFFGEILFWANLEKKFKMSQPIRGCGGHVGFPISPKGNSTSITIYFYHVFFWFQQPNWERVILSSVKIGQHLKSVTILECTHVSSDVNDVIYPANCVQK